MELQLTEDDSGLLDYLVLRPRRSNISIWDVHRLLWDATPETARRESENEEIITFSSNELAALIAAHATNLKRFIDRGRPATPMPAGSPGQRRVFVASRESRLIPMP